MVKSWTELGLAFKEMPASYRMSMNGRVSHKITGQQWLKDQGRSVQKQILGKRKAAAFRAGDITFKDIVDDRGHVRTLEKLGLTARN